MDITKEWLIAKGFDNYEEGRYSIDQEGMSPMLLLDVYEWDVGRFAASLIAQATGVKSTICLPDIYTTTADIEELCRALGFDLEPGNGN